MMISEKKLELSIFWQLCGRDALCSSASCHEALTVLYCTTRCPDWVWQEGHCVSGCYRTAFRAVKSRKVGAV